MSADENQLPATSKNDLLQVLLSSRITASTTVDPTLSRNSGDHVVASAGQRRLWFLDELQGSGASYNSPFLLRLQGPLDLPALRASIEELLTRHEALRTRLAQVDDEIVQIVDPPAELTLEPVDLSSLEPSEAERQAAEEITRAARSPFRLSVGPLLRVLLVKLSPTRHQLLINIHHIITDGWSEDIFFAELGRLYSARSSGRPIHMPMPSRQYADYARWESAPARAAEFAAHARFWSTQLSGQPPMRRVQPDRPRPPHPSGAGGVGILDLPKILQSQLTGNSAGHGYSPFVLFAAAFAIMLADFSGDDQLFIGTPVANRTRPEWESTVGFFVNTVTLRVQLDDEMSVNDVLAGLRRVLLEALDHQALPFDQVVDAVEAERSLGIHPLFQALCTVNEAPVPPALAGLDVELTELRTGTAKFDLELKARYRGETVEAWLEFADDLFDPSTIQRMAARLTDLLALIVDEPTRRLDQIRRKPDPAHDLTAAPALPISTRSPVVDLGRTGTEAALALIWAKALHLEQVSSDQDFFHAGGNSLMATRVMIQIRRTWSIDATVRLLFETPVLRDLADEIDRVRAVPPEPTPGPGPASAGTVEPGPLDGVLSFAQERLWFIHQLDPSSASYNIPYLCEVQGPLDLDALAWSLRQIVGRHQVLRTRIGVTNGRPVPVPSAGPDEPFSVVDRAGQPLEAVLRAINVELFQPFDLATGPLMRIGVHRMSPDHHVISFCWHHIVFDEWSLLIFQAELSAFYRAATGATAADLPELRMQYEGQAAWERRELSDENLARSLSYWKAHLDGAPTVSGPPLDHPRPAMRSARGASRSVVLPDVLVRQLEDLGRDADSTLYMTLLAAFQALLGWNKGQDDLVIGTAVSNRHHPDSEHLIGVFVNTLALRADVSGDPTFLTLLDRVRTTVRDGLAHQQVPLEKVIEALRPERSPAYNPLFQVSFDLADHTARKLDLAGAVTRSLPTSDPTSLFDLTLWNIRTDHGLISEISYSTDLFDQSTIDRLLRAWELLLGEIVDRPTARLSALISADHAETDLVNAAVTLPELPSVPSSDPPPPSPSRPPTPTESVVSDIWQELLGLDDIGPHENFFDLGGYSLLTTSVTAQIRSRLGREIRLAEFYAAPTVAGLATLIDTAPRPTDDEPPITRRTRR